MRALFYSDIHHDEYTNGVTLNDTIDVEDMITKYALDRSINNIFFLGDWYKATNPTQVVIKAAESAWKRRSDAGIMTRVLVGNHDRFTKSPTSQHAFMGADVFKQDLKLVSVIDTISSFTLAGVEFVCIPAGHHLPPDSEYFNKPAGKLVRAVLFHGVLYGSALANGASASSGIHPTTINKMSPDLAIGGDNHTPQRLDKLLHCPSMYLGAPLQHNWGDCGQERGFWDVTIDAGHIEFTQISSGLPNFAHVIVDAKTEIEVINKVSDKILKERVGIIEVTLVGDHEYIDVPLVEKTLYDIGLRRVKVVKSRAIAKTRVIPQNVVTSEDKWATYVHAIHDGILNPNKLIDLGNWALQEAKRHV